MASATDTICNSNIWSILAYPAAVNYFSSSFRITTYVHLYNTSVLKVLFVGCPRNNHIFFSVRTETNRNSICFGCFSVCFAKPKTFFSVCFGVSYRYRNNRNKQNFLETNRKNLLKPFSIRGSSKPLILFLGLKNRNKPKLNLFQLFFGLLFTKPKNFFFGLFWFVSMFRTGTETNRNYSMVH
jgi:hypothetical protein